MKLPVFLTLLAASIGSAGAAAAAVYALTPSPQVGALTSFAAEAPATEPGLFLIDSDEADEDDDDENGGWGLFEDDDEDCDDDEKDCASKGNAVPPGSVEPPKNGLFGDGKAPVVKIN